MQNALVPSSVVPVPVGAQVRSDDRLVELWLHGRSPHTIRVYRADVEAFLAFVGRPLGQVTLGDLQAYADALADRGLAPASRSRKLSAVKSLLTFGQRTGYLPFNVGAAVNLPRPKDTLAERILTEREVRAMLKKERNPRNRALLLLLYAGGLRVSEVCALKWRDLQEREEAGQVTAFGKGGRTRVVLLPGGVWDELVAIRGEAGPDDPVFASRKGGHLQPRQVARIVNAAANRAGVDKPVSPHWLRHAHASHAMDHGAPVHLVQATLGHTSVATTGRYLHARPTDSSARYLRLPV